MGSRKYVLICLLVCCPFISCTDVTYNSAVYRDIITNYTKEVRPMSSPSSTLTVNVAGHLISIHDFDAVSGTLTIVLMLNVHWKDERLTWDSAPYGVGHIKVPQSKIWVPQLYNIKAADSFSPIGGTHFIAMIDNTGDISMNPGGKISINCSPDVSKFPYDIQTCHIELCPWMYAPDEVELSAMVTNVGTDHYDPNAEWTIMDTGAMSTVKPVYSAVIFTIKMKRIPFYHITNTLVPVYFLGFLNPLVFILPCDSGERSGYSLTMLLSYTVFMMVINASLPQSSDPMAALSFVILGAFVCSVLITVLNNFQLRMYHKDDSVPVPKWLARFVTCLSCTRKTCLSRVRRRTVVSGEVEENIGTERNDNDKTDVTADAGNTESIDHPTWKTVVNVLDKFYMCVLYGFVILGTFVTTIYLNT